MEQTQSQSANFFHRPDLALAYANEALDTSLGSSGGLFLAAPRRTGKSTFVRQDLIPALVARQAQVIYVDLWSDKTKDPALLLANAIRAEIRKDDGALTKFARAAGLTKLNIGALGNGLNFDLSQIGLSADASLTDALSTLSQACGQLIVLVIDEAQHALTSTEGMNALFGLKAARDALNLAGRGLQVIATGSNRDKLALLVNGREQPFFGATLIDFPKLDRDYIDWVCRKAGIGLDPLKTLEVFKETGARPEMILPAIRQLRLQPPAQTDSVDQALAGIVREGLTNAKEEFLHTLANLPALQAAVLRELAGSAALAPGTERPGVFSGAMMRKLKARIAQDSPSERGVQVDGSSVQNALDSLREKSFLWKSQRGAYWIEDDQLIAWLTRA